MIDLSLIQCKGEKNNLKSIHKQVIMLHNTYQPISNFVDIFYSLTSTNKIHSKHLLRKCCIQLEGTFYLEHKLKQRSPAGHSTLQEVHHLLCVLLGAVVEINTLYQRKQTLSNTLNQKINHMCIKGHPCCRAYTHANTHTH